MYDALDPRAPHTSVSWEIPENRSLLAQELDLDDEHRCRVQSLRLSRGVRAKVPNALPESPQASVSVRECRSLPLFGPSHGDTAH